MSEKVIDHVEHIANEITGGVDDSEWAYEWHEDNCHRWDADDEETLSEHLEWCDERPTAFDWLEDALDIEYTINSRHEYLGARILVAFGGPSIWVNTREGVVEGYWWSDSATRAYTDNLGLDDALLELFEIG